MNKTTIVLGLALLGLVSCGGNSTPREPTITTENTFTYKGCTIDFVRINGNSDYVERMVYVTQCPNSLPSTTWEERRGKYTSTKASISIGTNEALQTDIAQLDKQKAELELKLKAISKLSDEEKKALGL